jgi:ankyrin repeat protein
MSGDLYMRPILSAFIGVHRRQRTLFWLTGLCAAGFLSGQTSGDGLTPLHKAVQADDIAAVKKLLAAGADARAATTLGHVTPLALGAINGDAAIIQALLNAGAGVDVANADGDTPLMLAAASGSADAIKALLDHGAAINAKEPVRGETPLMFAAGRNRADAVKFLIARGADPAATSTVVKLERPLFDEDGNPIAAAGRGGAAGASGGAAGGRGGRGGRGGAAGASGGVATFAGGRGGGGERARSTPATVTGGMTALLLASRNGYIEAARALLDAGADVNQACAGDKSTPIVIAIANGHYDLAKYLLEHGANPNLASIDGLAALYAVEDTEYAEVGWAPNPITAQEKTTYLELLKELLDHKADPNQQLLKALWFRPTSHNQEWVDKKGATPFWRAAMATDVAAMKILLAGGADPKIASAEGVTPLMVAAGLGWGANASRTVPNGWLPAVQFLVTETGADVNAKDDYNYTALHGAAYRGDNEVVKYLVSKGAKLDVRSKSGQTLTDMANGPMVNAHLPIDHPDTIALLESLGAPPPEVPVAGAPKQGRGAAAAAPTTTK